MAVTMRELLEAGVHFGHQTRRWNPKMRPYIFTERNGIHIVDLRMTVSQVERAAKWSRSIASDGGTLLFVGTKKQAQDAIEKGAQIVRHALCQPSLARRHAHQLPDHSPPHHVHA